MIFVTLKFSGRQGTFAPYKLIRFTLPSTGLQNNMANYVCLLMHGTMLNQINSSYGDHTINSVNW